MSPFLLRCRRTKGQNREKKEGELSRKERVRKEGTDKATERLNGELLKGSNQLLIKDNAKKGRRKRRRGRGARKRD